MINPIESARDGFRTGECRSESWTLVYQPIVFRQSRERVVKMDTVVLLDVTLTVRLSSYQLVVESDPPWAPGLFTPCQLPEI